MSKKSRPNKYCNCQISSNKEILKDNISHSFCDKCGCVLLKGSGGNIYYTLKTKQRRLPYDLSPITLIQHMKKMTEDNYPYIYEDFNINKNDKYAKEKAVKSINIYLKYRKLILLKLQKLMKIFDYCDMIFYQCLYFLDLYLSHEMTEECSEKKVLYNLIGYFLISVKFKEIDIYEPSLDSFFDLSQGIYFSMDKIAYYEVICLKKINYNVFTYSAYDWVSQLTSNGIVFNCELNSANEVILIKGHRHSLVNTINKYTIKLLLNLTSKSLFFKYCPMYIAMSLIQIAREKYIDKNLIKEKLFFKLINLYGVKYEDYKKCYEEILSEIEEVNPESDKNLILDQTQKNKSGNEKETQPNSIKDGRGESTKKSYIKSKNLYVPNKVKSSNTIIRINNPIINSRNDENSPNDNNEELNTETKDKEDSKVELTLTEIDSKKKYKIKSIKNSNVNNINTIGRYSIDCKVNNANDVKSIFKSNDDLPFINTSSKERYSMYTINEEEKAETPHHKNISYNKKKNKPMLKELQHVRTNAQRYNSIKTQVNNSSFNSSIDREKEKVQEPEKESKKKSKFFSMSNKNVEVNNVEERFSRKKLLTSTKLPLISNFDDKLDTNDISNLRKNIGHKTKKHYKLKKNINNIEIKVNLPEEESKRIESSKNALEVH